jgi:NAD(P)-dependent dehydrogenase (short-subunit alcohol dehydrogenase family)
MAKHTIPHLIAGGGGSIVSMSSMQAYRAIPGRVGVQAAKGGICAMTRELALEYGPAGVRVNSVLPGFTVTEKAERDYAKSATPEELDLRRDCYPLRRFGRPDDVANAVLFLASDEAAWITGIDLLVDGGTSMQLAEAVMFPPFRRLWQQASPSA